MVTLAGVERWVRRGDLTPPLLIAIGVSWVVGLVGTIAPRRMERVYLLATTLTAPIGRVVSVVMLAAAYFSIVTPMALLLRLVRRDRLARDIDRAAPTYWAPRRERPDPSRYFRQS
jgi:hypothetical protein